MNKRENMETPQKGRLKSLGSLAGTLRNLFYLMISYILPRFGVNRLISAMGSPDEETSMGAYMALVTRGPKIADILVDAARQGNQVKSVLQVLGDLGNKKVIPSLEEFSKSDDPLIAEVAQESIRCLENIW